MIRLVDVNGSTAAYYEYDPYGKAIQAAGSHATINPLRYRGYVYDTETGFYYLQSRYYDPQIGRFINSDVYAATGQGFIGNNMFAYCINNPCNMMDSAGTDAIYVTQTSGDNSLPVVGHALLYFQDADGKWHVTEFTGSSKKDAKVSLDDAKMDDVERMLNNESISGVQYTYIEGDFSDCYDLAKKYDNTDYGGYNLLFNNCVHYTKEILMEGEFDNTIAQDIIKLTPILVPTVFHAVIIESTALESVWRYITE